VFILPGRVSSLYKMAQGTYWKSPGYALSLEEMNFLLPGVPVTLYPELQGKLLADIVDSHGRGIVLFVQRETKDAIEGHWLAICRQRHGILLFDPYGGHQDPWYLNHTFVSNRALKALREEAPLLDGIVQRSNMQPLYNEVRYQRMSPDVDTCGRHCVVRLWNAGMEDTEYHRFMQAQGDDFDKAVTELTNEVLASMPGIGGAKTVGAGSDARPVRTNIRHATKHSTPVDDQ
jgi:hypothetical protein